MKEIALTGNVNHVSADITGKLLGVGLSVAAYVDYPERVMLDDSRLTVEGVDFHSVDSLEKALSGYTDAILTYSDDLENPYTNDLTLKTFVDSVFAARKAGVARIIVVGSPLSEAFFVTELRRLDDIDWVFISTEGDYPDRVVEQVVNPTLHKEEYKED